MTKDMAEFLVEVTESLGNQEISLREGYSGRGMYGKETCGVVVENILQLFSDILEYARDNINDYMGEGSDGEQFKTWDGKMIPQVENFRMDNMGRQYIIY